VASGRRSLDRERPDPQPSDLQRPARSDRFRSGSSGAATVRALQASGPVTGFRAVTARTATPIAQEATLTYLVTDELHHEVRSLLQKLHAGPIVTAVERPSSGQFLPHRFFVASALGESPNGKSLSARGIAPFRCLDPMRWVMAETGML